MTRVTFIYVTVGTCDEAETIARTVVTEGLAACANILSGMRSVYRWDGRVDSADEVVLILKTVADGFERVADRVRSLHSYRTPCIVELPIGRGEAAYLDWIAANSGRPGTEMDTGAA